MKKEKIMLAMISLCVLIGAVLSLKANSLSRYTGNLYCTSVSGAIATSVVRYASTVAPGGTILYCTTSYGAIATTTIRVAVLQ